MNADQVLSCAANKRFENTNCPYSVVASQTAENEEMQFILEIQLYHNHSGESLNSLSFEDIPGEISESITDMYRRGLLPGAAHRQFMLQLKSECCDAMEYHKRLSDRAQVSRRKDFNEIYTNLKNQLYGTSSLYAMFSVLETKINELKENEKECTIVYHKFDEELSHPTILVIITPLMKRVHQLVRNFNNYVFYFICE